MSGSNYVIVGDCGGTNTRLSLINIPEEAPSPKRGDEAPGKVAHEHKFLNENFKCEYRPKLHVGTVIKARGGQGVQLVYGPRSKS